MPSTSGKRTKPTTRKTTTRATTKSSTAAKATKATPKTATKTAPKVATKATTKTTTSSRASKTVVKDAERIQSLESTVTKLIEILDSEFKSELRQGPKNVSAKLRNAGLIK